MQVMNSTSPSFGGIVVKTSGMNGKKRVICERLFNDLKYNANYSKLESGNKLDIYMLAKEGKKGIEVRIIDLLSGNYVKDASGKIFKRNLCDTENKNIASVTDRIVEMYENITKGIIARPKVDIDKIFEGKIDVDKLDYRPLISIKDAYAELKDDCYCTDAEARKMAYSIYTTACEYGDRDIF